MRADIGDLVSLPGVSSWVLVTDAAALPESIIIGQEVTVVAFNPDGTPQFVVTDNHHITDNSLVTSVWSRQDEDFVID